MCIEPSLGIRGGFEWLSANRERLGIPPSTWDLIDTMRALQEKYTMAAVGQIVGEIDIVDCVDESSSVWFFGPEYKGKRNHGLVLANPALYATPKEYRGMPGLFEINSL